MGIYLPHGFTDLTAQYIVDRFTKVIDELDLEMFNDYIDNLVFNVAKPNEFSIRYVPAIGNLRFYINGILYDEGDHYHLDRANKKITWLFTKAEGGFDIEPHYKLLAVYDIYLKDNDLQRLDQIQIQE
jgi:hypothetical protein